MGSERRNNRGFLCPVNSLREEEFWISCFIDDRKDRRGRLDYTTRIGLYTWGSTGFNFSDQTSYSKSPFSLFCFSKFRDSDGKYPFPWVEVEIWNLYTSFGTKES